MKIVYDKNVKLLGMAMVPWSRLGPEKWFSNVAISSVYNWDAVKAGVVVDSLQDYIKDVDGIKNTQQLIDNEIFKNQIAKKYTGYNVLTYKPVKPPVYMGKYNMQLINNNRLLSRKIENKAYFRSLFVDKINIPNHKIFRNNEIDNSVSFYNTLVNKFSSLIIQDEKLSDGRGTFGVSNYDDYIKSIDYLKKVNLGGLMVVSERINAYERSVQCVITKHGIFVGPLQKQIIANKLLVNTEIIGGSKFCGGEILDTLDSDNVYSTVKELSIRICNILKEKGYKGILGIDLLITKTGKVYVIEVNARVTGMTPLLTMLNRGEEVPFYLLHILELLGAEYEIYQKDYQPITIGSMLLLHNKDTRKSVIRQSPKSGVYDEKYSYQSDSINFASEDDKIIIHQYLPKGTMIKKDSRLLTFYLKSSGLDIHDELTNETARLIEHFDGKVLKEVIDER